MRPWADVVLISVMLCTACSGSLTRSRAEEILRAKFPPSNEGGGLFYVSVEGSCFDQDRDVCGPEALPPGTKELERQGYISITHEPGAMRISFTDKGRQYLTRSDDPINYSFTRGNREFRAFAVHVWAATNEFGAVTGISGGGQSNEVTVEFTTVVKPTPFGQFQPVTRARRALFRKYDDGWRLTSTE